MKWGAPGPLTSPLFHSATAFSYLGCTCIHLFPVETTNIAPSFSLPSINGTPSSFFRTRAPFFLPGFANAPRPPRLFQSRASAFLTCLRNFFCSASTGYLSSRCFLRLAFRVDMIAMLSFGVFFPIRLMKSNQEPTRSAAPGGLFFPPPLRARSALFFASASLLFTSDEDYPILVISFSYKSGEGEISRASS